MFSTSCGVNNCHKVDSEGKVGSRLVYQNPPGGLWAVLSTPIPDFEARKCIGSTLVVPNNVDGSLLPKIIAGPTAMITCKGKGQDQMVDRMPDACHEGDEQRPCMTPAMIQLIKDWIAAGAPHT